MEEEVDPVKRTIVYVPKVVKPKGRLRCVCVFVSNCDTTFLLYDTFILADGLAMP